MATDFDDVVSHDAQLDAVIASYLEAEEEGQAPDPAEWLARYPSLREPLSRFLEAHRRMHRLTGPLRAVAQADGGRTPVHHTTLSDGLRRPRGPETVQVTLDNYELLDEIGRGGMGVVYRAQQKVPGRLVALKLLRPSLVASADDVRRFRNEAELLALLDHPQIVPVYEVGEQAGQMFFTMKLLAGGSLRAHLRRYRGDTQAAAGLVASVARALHHAHQRGILHRDLKPSNILLDAEGRPHLSDFGLAKRLTSLTGATGLTQTGMLLGTPAYMAPEQVAGNAAAVTTATDVYGLGAVLYTLLTGAAPFVAETPLQTLALVQTSEPRPPRTFDPRLDRDLETVCLKCLEKEPGRRYPSAEALAEDLDRWQAGRPVRARPVGRWERLGRWSRRNPLVAALAALSSGLLLAGLAGLVLALVIISEKHAEAVRQGLAANAERANALQRSEEVRNLLYAAHMEQAYRAWERSDVAQARDLLARHIPEPGQQDLRGFEWYYLCSLCEGTNAALAALPAHDGAIYCVRYTRDSTRLFTAGQDRAVRAWDVASGRQLWQLGEFYSDADVVVLSPDGTTLVAAGEDGSIWACDAATGAGAVRIVQEAVPIPQVAFAPDGKSLAAALWDGTVRLYEFPSGRPTRVFEAAHPPKAEAVAFTADGRTLVTAGRDRTAKVWDVATGALRHTLAHNEEVKAVVVARGRPLVATACYDRTIGLWDLETATKLATLPGHFGRVLSVAIAPDDAVLASVDDFGSVRLWELPSGRLLNVFAGDGRRCWSVAFAPDGRVVATGGDGGRVDLRDARSRRYRRLVCDALPAVRQIVPRPHSAELGILFLDETRTVGLLDLASGSLREVARTDRTPRCLAFSADGATAFTGREDGTVQLWSLPGGQLRWSTSAHTSPVNSMALTPDGRLLVTACFGKPLQLWDPENGKALGTVRLAPEGTAHLALTPEGPTLAVASEWGRLELVDLAQRRVRRTLTVSGPRAVALAFSADGTLLAAGLHNHPIEVWEVASGRRCQHLAGHRNSVTSLAFAPDGRTLASAAGDSTVILWHVATGQKLLTLPAAACTLAVAFSADGRLLLAGGRDGAGRGEVFAWEAPRDAGRNNNE